MLVAGVSKFSVRGERCRTVGAPACKEVAPNDAIGELRREVIEVDLGSSSGDGGRG